MPGPTPSETKLAKADFELLAEFRYALRRFLGFSERAAGERGITPQQYQVLLAIEGYPGRNWVTMGELAEQMQVAHHTAVGLVDRMEAHKLVKRSPSAADRRRVEVSLTARGARILDQLYRVHRAELRTVGPRLAGLLIKAAADNPGSDGPKGA